MPYMNPHWNAGKVGQYPIRADAECIYCHEKLAKVHGLNRSIYQEIRTPTVMGWFLGGTGPRCVWCHTKAWNDPDFWRRSGSTEHHSARWGLPLRG